LGKKIYAKAKAHRIAAGAAKKKTAPKDNPRCVIYNNSPKS